MNDGRLRKDLALGLQDAHRIGCLVILDPLVMGQLSQALSWPGDGETFERSDWVQTALRQEIDRLVSSETGFKRHEFLADFRVVPGPFRLGEEITIAGNLKQCIFLNVYFFCFTHTS